MEDVQKRVRRAESEEMEAKRKIIAKNGHVLEGPKFSKDRTAKNKYAIKGIIVSEVRTRNFDQNPG
jgi:hypothetical protein